VERFLGFTNYHRVCIKEYTQMALPLQALTGKRTYHWGEEQERAFDDLRKAIVRAPVLALRLLWSVLTVKCLPNK
jgi:hypothetical protein